LLAINGLGVGIGATIVGFADLVFMSTEARLRCPFPTLGVAPEAASSFTFPQLVGRQDASWVLMSAEWLDAETCRRIGLAWRVCLPDELMPATLEHAGKLARMPISSLVETKRCITEPLRPQIEA